MILFESDWASHPGAIPDINTRNISFLKMAKLFADKGVRNNKFMLALHQPDLAKYDPHNLNDPSIELRMRIGVECRVNPWYYLREVTRVPAQGSLPIPFIANRSNIAMSWCAFNNIDYFSVQPRQTGKAQVLSANIKTPTGWTRMGDLLVGHKVMAPDGTETTVVGVYPQGIRPVYRITFEDGRHTDCDISHLWKVYDSKKGDGFEIIDLAEIKRRMSSRPNNEHGLSIPLIQPGPSGIDDAVQLKSLLDGFTKVGLTYNGSGRCYRTNSEALARCAQYLVRSLGGVCEIELVKSKRSTLQAYFVHAKIPSTDLSLGIKSIEYVGEHLTQCIEVDHPEHLYVTDDFIVTHNTIGALTLTAYYLYIAGFNLDMALYANSKALIQANVGRVKDIRDALPKYLIDLQIADTENKEGLSYTALKNEYKTFCAQSSIQAADKQGRGQSCPWLHGDEIGFCENIDITFPVMRAAMNAAIRTAADNGQPHASIFTTTAARIDTTPGEFAYNLMLGAMPFNERIYDTKNHEELKKLIKMNSTNNTINGTFSYLQLGYSHDWFIETVARLNTTQDVIDRDFLNLWKSGSETSIIPAHLLMRMNETKIDPIHVQFFGDYVVNWYISEVTRTSPEFKRRQLALGMDCSENIGQDFTALCLIDLKDMSVVATFRCNETNTIALGMFVAEFLMAYTNITFIPESNSMGRAILETIIMIFKRHRINPFRRIYNKIFQDMDTEPSLQSIRVDDPDLWETAVKKYLGFRTGEKTRIHLYKQVLQKAVSLNATRMYDNTLISELSGLSVVNGRIDHTNGGHDDMAIAYLLACHLVFAGKNLQMYGIDKAQMLSGMTTTGDQIDPDYKAQQLELRKRIKHFEALIDRAPSPTVKLTYQHHLNALVKQLDETITLEPISSDKVQQDLRTYGEIYTANVLPFAPKKKLPYTSQDLIRVISGVA